MALGTKSVEFQQVIHFAETQSLGHFFQLILEAIQHEIFGAPAVSTPQMVVVFEALAFAVKCGSVGGFNRFEDPVSGQGIEVAIHGGEADFRTGCLELGVDLGGGEEIGFLVQSTVHQFELAGFAPPGRGSAVGMHLGNRCRIAVFAGAHPHSFHS